jgi:hypothetical protein
LTIKASHFEITKDAQMVNYEKKFGVKVEVPEDDFISLVANDLKKVCSSLVPNAQSDFIFRTKVDIALDSHTSNGDVVVDGTTYNLSLMNFQGVLKTKPLVIKDSQGSASIYYECRVGISSAGVIISWESVGFNVRHLLYLVQL